MDGDIECYLAILHSLMTYCFAFTLPPDGLAVISDTRISFGERHWDAQQKVIFPDEKSFVAISGTIGKLAILLEGISQKISDYPVEKRIDVLSHELRRRYSGMFNSGELRSDDAENHGMSIIYGDIRYARNTTRTRLVKFGFTVKNGLPVIEFSSAPRFGWLAIGLNPVMRQFISNTAADRLMQLEERSLRITEVPYQKNPFPGKTPYMAMDDRSTSKHGSSPSTFQLYSGGSCDGTYRAVLRKFYNEQKQLGRDISFLEPIQEFGAAVMQRIAGLAEEMKNLPDMNLISNTWCLATISRERVKIYTYKDIGSALGHFSEQTREVVL